MERRKVHEQLQVLRGNIRVCCRVRPSLGAASGEQVAAVTYPYPGSLCVAASERRQQEFEFDAVFSGEASQVGTGRGLQRHRWTPRQCVCVCAAGTGTALQSHLCARRWRSLMKCGP